MTTEIHRDRVQYLLKTHWKGNQSEMAKDTKCGQATISLIANGKKIPGKRVLAMIGATFGVNADWLFDGIGEPVSQKPGTRFSQEYTLPIYDRALVRIPDERIGAFTGVRLEVNPKYALPHNYLLKLGRDEPILASSRRSLLKGDLLLITTDKRQIPSGEELFGDLVVIVSKSRPDVASLAEVEFSQDREERDLKTIEANEFKEDVIDQQIERKQIRRKQNSGHEWERVIYDGEIEKIVPISSLALSPGRKSIDYVNIVGICIAMIRSMVRPDFGF